MPVSHARNGFCPRGSRCAAGVLALLGMILAAPLVAQSPSPSLAPLVARLPGGTRELSMANAGLGATNASVIFYNPAQVARSSGTDFSAQWYGASTLLTSLATTIKLGSGAVGLGVNALGLSGPAAGLGTPDSLGAQGGTGATSYMLTLGYARELIGVRVGANLNLMDQSLGAARDRRGAVDVGLARDFMGGVLGVSAQHLGPAFRYDGARTAQPMQMNAGYTTSTFQVGWVDLLAAARVSRVHGNDWIAGLGGELAWSWLDGYEVAARAGVRSPGAGEGPWTAGFGLTADRITLDVAFESRQLRAGAWRVGLSIL